MTASRPDTQIIARTKRLLLRTEAEGDRDIWRTHMNSPQIMAHIGGPRTDAQIARTFQCMDVWEDELMGDYWNEDDWPFILLERRSDGLLIGHCGLSLIDIEDAPPQLQRQTQIGWTLRTDCWGQGYAREAAEAVMTIAFEHRGLSMLFAQTATSNVPSRRLMERLGMKHRAELDYTDSFGPGPDAPMMVYRLTRNSWHARGPGMAPATFFCTIAHAGITR